MYRPYGLRVLFYNIIFLFFQLFVEIWAPSTYAYDNNCLRYWVNNNHFSSGKKHILLTSGKPLRAFSLTALYIILIIILYIVPASSQTIIDAYITCCEKLNVVKLWFIKYVLRSRNAETITTQKIIQPYCAVLCVCWIKNIIVTGNAYVWLPTEKD